MATESASNTVGNGNVPKTAPDSPQPAPKTEHFLYTLILTIYDVIIFLGISIGYIFQVRVKINIATKPNQTNDNDQHHFDHR